MAARANSLGPEINCKSVTLPSSPITACNTTVPWICALRASSGYTGATCRISNPRETPLATSTRFGVLPDVAAEGLVGLEDNEDGVVKTSRPVVVLPSAETPFSMILSLNAKSIGSLVENFTGLPFLLNGLNLRFL